MIEGTNEQRREVFYAGQVQGVGFRFTARSIASRFAVAGWVKNLPDGRVRLQVEGKPAELDRFLGELAAAMSGNIEDVEIRALPIQGAGPGFEIRH